MDGWMDGCFLIGWFVHKVNLPLYFCSSSVVTATGGDWSFICSHGWQTIFALSQTTLIQCFMQRVYHFTVKHFHDNLPSTLLGLFFCWLRCVWVQVFPEHLSPGCAFFCSYGESITSSSAGFKEVHLVHQHLDIIVGFRGEILDSLALTVHPSDTADSLKSSASLLICDGMIFTRDFTKLPSSQSIIIKTWDPLLNPSIATLTATLWQKYLHYLIEKLINVRTLNINVWKVLNAALSEIFKVCFHYRGGAAKCSLNPCSSGVKSGFHQCWVTQLKQK